MKYVLPLACLFLIGCAESNSSSGDGCVHYEVGTWLFEGDAKEKKVQFLNCGKIESTNNTLVEIRSETKTEFLSVLPGQVLPAGIGGGESYCVNRCPSNVGEWRE